MTTPLAPTAIQLAVNRIDKTLDQLLARDKQIIKTLNAALNSSKNTDGTAITAAQIIAAGGDRYANLQALITSMQGSVNILAPGTY